MSQKDFALAVRMKGYEAVTHAVLPRRLPVIIRVDGRAFHTYLKNANKPFDMSFVTLMGEVARNMCEGISGAVMAYAQSDEISILVCDYLELDTWPWFGGEVQKIVSVTASMATLHFCAGATARGGMTWRNGPSLPMFDSRVFVVPDAVEAANYFVWRQKDAIRNAVSMAAQAVFTPAQLHGVNTAGMRILLAGAGVDFEELYNDRVKRGQYVRRLEFPFGPDAWPPEAAPSARSNWLVGPAPIFEAASDNILARLIPPTSVFGPNPKDNPPW